MYDINQSLLASPKIYNVGRGGKKVEYIVEHYTAHIAPARNFALYAHNGGSGNSSFHYVLDGNEIYMSVHPANTAWQAGNSDFNQRSIGIEVVSNGEDFSRAEIDQLSWLTRKLMAEYGIDADHVIRHYDVIDHVVTGSTVNPHKMCPAPYTPNGADPTGKKWEVLHRTITQTSGFGGLPMEFLGRSNSTNEPLYYFCGMSYKPVNTQVESQAIQDIYKKVNGVSIPMIESPEVKHLRSVIDGH